MLLRGIGVTHIGVSREPSLCDPRDRDGRPEITPLGVQQTYLQGRFFFTAGLAKPAPPTVINGRVYSLPQWNYMSFFHDPLLAIWVYTLRGVISHHVGEPAYCWWSTDTDVSVEAIGMQQTLSPW